MEKDYNLQLDKWKALAGEPSTLLIGIDVSRLKHDACFGIRDRVFCRNFTFENHLKGFEKLIEKTKSIHEGHKLDKILLGVEPTSFYWYPLYEFLKSKNLTVCLLDPTSVFHNRKTLKKDNGKSDKKDAYSIYDLLSQKKIFFSVNTTKQGFSAKIALKNWMSVQNILISIKSRMRSFMSLSFPELESKTEIISNPKFLAFLKKYPTPAFIVKQSEDDFISENLKKPKLYNAEELKEIYDLAKTTVGVPLLLEMGELTILKLIEDLEYQLNQEKIWFKSCNKIAMADSGYERVKAIKGLGPKITTGILLALGDYDSITNATQVTKLAGLNLVDKTSGSSINKPSRISHQGCEALRFWGYHASMQVIKHKGTFKTLYERKRKNSPGKGSGKRALIAVCDKLIRVSWAILKKGGVYQKDYDKKIKAIYSKK